ncbi:MAG TPA: DUF1214 domain-containing protein [Solimonas sp.]
MSAEQDVVSGAVWDEFCDTLKRAGQQILRPEAASSPLDRAEGWRYLTRLLRIGLEMHLEFADPDFPGFFLPSHETGKIGADNPDNLYAFAKVKGDNDYIIRGNRGTVSYLSIGTQKGGYETDGKMEPTGFIDVKDLQTDIDGNFELRISRNKPAHGNWLAMESASNAVIVRQTFMDRKAETPATLAIARANSEAQPQPLSAEALQARLRNTARFVEGTATVFANWAQSYLPNENKLPSADQALCQATGGDPNIHYYHAAWKLAPDEALVIRIPRIPECRFWNLQINNWWMESLDYRYHDIHVNKHSARIAADGSCTIVLAHRDPGVANWVETASHERGTMCMRWVGASEHVDPTTQVIKHDQLEKALTGALAA